MSAYNTDLRLKLLELVYFWLDFENIFIIFSSLNRPSCHMSISDSIVLVCSGITCVITHMMTFSVTEDLLLNIC